ncbi:AMP-binding protein [Robbsia sp. KACC 23696]|uniref:AMP-binding protein n=1 Tax=Robbsia sp. KACC 23696 TaxID=3149231 RepID=UPI00325BF5EF
METTQYESEGNPVLDRVDPSNLNTGNGRPARPWVARYPLGVPAEITIPPGETLVSLIEESCRKYAAREAFVCMGQAISYQRLADDATAFAGWLQALGLKKGTRVAIMLPNVLQYPVALFGAMRAGCIVVNVNPLYTPRELGQQLRDSGAEAIVILENFAATLQKALPETTIRHVLVTSVGAMLGAKGVAVDIVLRHVKRVVPAWDLPQHDGWHAALAIGRKRSFAPVSLSPDDIAILQYTGGTTGVAKGAILLHRNLLANTLQAEAWFRPALAQLPNGGEGSQMIIAAALPLYHIFALTVCGLFPLRIGGKVLLMPNPRDLPAVIKVLARYPVNIFPAVNTLYNALLNHPDIGKADFSQLVVAVGGGMAVQETVAKRWEALTGRLLVEGYGLSETSPIVSSTSAIANVFTGSIGMPMPSTDIAIRDADDHDVPYGDSGELCVKGPQVMAGYWQKPDETRDAMTPDGYFRTGDIARFDADGNLKLVDRKKDMILVSGFNVYPNEIEDVVASLRGVAEVAAVGVPDARSGESVKLFIVRRDETLDEATVLAHCRERLTPYKMPRMVVFRESLPKTPVGKILRRELRDLPK